MDDSNNHVQRAVSCLQSSSQTQANNNNRTESVSDVQYREKVCLHPLSVSHISRQHSLLRRQSTLFPDRGQTDTGSLALHTFYEQLKQLCQLESSASNDCLLTACGVASSSDDVPTISTRRLQVLIEGGGYELAQYQLYLTEMKRINPNVSTDHLVINGLYQLTKSLVRSNQGVVYGDQSVESIDVRQAVKSHSTERLILGRFWLQPSQSEEIGVFNAIGSSFVEFIYNTFGRKGVKQLVSVVGENLDSPEDFVFRGHTMSKLECQWREYVETSASCQSQMSIFQFIGCLFKHYFKHHVFHVVFMLLLSCADVAALLSISLLIGQLFDHVAEPDHRTSTLVNPAYQLFIVWCGQMTIALIHVMMSVRLAVQISCKLREQLFSKMHRVRPAFFLANSGASIIACFSNDIEIIEYVIAITFTLCLQAVLLILASLVFLLLMEWRLTLGLMTFILFFQIVINVVAKKASYYQFDKGRCLSRLLSMMKENMEGYQVNMIYHLESYWSHVFHSLVKTNYVHRVVRSLQFTLSLQMVSMLHPHIIVISYLIVAAVLIKLDLFTYSKMLTMYTMAAFTAKGAVILGRSISQLTRAASGMGRLQALLGDTSTHIYTESTYRMQTSKMLDAKQVFDCPTVELRNVSFCYETHSTVWNLYDICLTIPFGQSVALVGRSGAGKSTLLSLITNMYSPTEGDILINGQSVRDIHPERLPFGVTLQQNYLFNMTIRDNIRLGRLDASSEDVKDAAKAAAIHQFIMQLPLQYDTLIGEQGASLSIGQQQRIAIARMVVRRPKILLLDDVTSALDASSEQKVFATIRKLFHHHTVIYVTHKLSLAQPADCIVFMSHGKVKEIGNHSNLLEKQGAYYHLWNEQQHLQNNNNDSEDCRRGEEAAEQSHTSSCTSTSASHLSHSGNPLRHTGSVDDIGNPQIIEFLIDNAGAYGSYVASSELKESQRRNSLPLNFFCYNKPHRPSYVSTSDFVGNHWSSFQRTVSLPDVGITLSHIPTDKSSSMTCTEKGSALDCQQMMQTHTHVESQFHVDDTDKHNTSSATKE